jgi:outer membrane receptor protein involved in Fe transport
MTEHYQMNPNNFRKHAALLMGCVSLTALASAAMAQGVETIMVTVDRRAADQQDLPVSTSTLSGDRLGMIFQSGMDVKALANSVPSLYAESSNGRVAPRFYIRGLGNSDFDLAASQPVSIIMDGVVQENVVLKSQPLFDIASIEVARGPQGTLFGRNTTAGIISFNTARPTQDQEYYINGSYGALDTSTVEGAYSVGISDEVSVRLSGLWQYRNDYIDNSFTGQKGALGGYEERAGRLQVLWEASDDFSALFNVHGRSFGGTAAIFRANIFSPGSNSLNGNYVYNKVAFDGGANNPAAYNGVGGGLTLSWTLPGVRITSITGYETTHGYSRGDIDGGNMVTGPGFIPFPSDTKDGLDYLNQFTQEVLFTSDYANSDFSWQAGAFYFTHNYQNSTDPGFVPPTSVRQGNTSLALFGQAKYQLDAFTFTGGVRWTSDVKSMTANGPLIFLPGGVQPLVKLRGNFVSWDASVAYAVNDDTNLYVRAATGFRAPSIQGRNFAFGGGYSTARSENVMSWEAGLKSDLAENLRVNLSGFQYYVHNMQFSAVGGAAVGNSIILLNAKGGEAYGLEADITWLPVNNLTVNLGASWTHTAIRDPGLRSGVCAQCTVTDPVAGGFASINDNPFPQAPDFLLSLSANYTYPLAGGDALFVNTSWWLQGATNFFLYTSREFNSNGNHQGDLKIGYTWPSGNYDLYAYAQNITDAENVQGGIDFNNLTGFVGDPRVFGIGLNIRH